MIKAVCGIILNEKNEVLSVSRKDNHKDFGLVGGLVEPLESSEQALIREVKEETGLDVLAYEPVFEKDGVVTYFVKTSGQILTEEPHVIKYIDISKSSNELFTGSFGEYNKELFSIIDLRDIGKLL